MTINTLPDLIEHLTDIAESLEASGVDLADIAVKGAMQQSYPLSGSIDAVTLDADGVLWVAMGEANGYASSTPWEGGIVD